MKRFWLKSYQNRFKHVLRFKEHVFVHRSCSINFGCTFVFRRRICSSNVASIHADRAELMARVCSHQRNMYGQHSRRPRAFLDVCSLIHTLVRDQNEIWEPLKTNERNIWHKRGAQQTMGPNKHFCFSPFGLRGSLATWYSFMKE